ncbi:MAG: HPr family phosphocarrier protein [Parachlamydiales bacterium]|nr:HPr family phosphocarrier protein [Parachlamydiales bacterium]
MKQSKQVRVKNILGLHTRPATVIVRLLKNCKSDVWFTYKRETINAKSIMSILMLGIKRNAKLTITVEGEDAGNTMTSLLHAFDNQFGE